MANYSSLPTFQTPTLLKAVSVLKLHSSPLMAFSTSRSNPSVSMKAHVHDASFESCQVGLSSTLTEVSTAVFLHQTSLPGDQWPSSAGYSHLATCESSPPLSASMLAHCLPTQVISTYPSSMKAHTSHFLEILSPSLATHCTFKWSPRAAEARKAAGCRKRRGIILDGGERRKRRKLDDADESEEQAGASFSSLESLLKPSAPFSSLEPQNSISMLSHTSQEFSHQQQGVSMVTHCFTCSFPSSCALHPQAGIVSLASHIVAAYHSEASVSTALVSFPGSLPPFTSLASHMAFFYVSPQLGNLKTPILALPPSPGPRGRKRGGDDLEVKHELVFL